MNFPTWCKSISITSDHILPNPGLFVMPKNRELRDIHKNVTMETPPRRNFLFTEAPPMWYDTVTGRLDRGFCNEFYCFGYGVESALARFTLGQKGAACGHPGGDHPDRCRAAGRAGLPRG